MKSYRALCDTTLLLWPPEWAEEFTQLYQQRRAEAAKGKSQPFPTRPPLDIAVKANQEVSIEFLDRQPLITVTSDKRDRVINSVGVRVTIGSKVHNLITLAYDDAEPDVSRSNTLKLIKKRK